MSVYDKSLFNTAISKAKRKKSKTIVIILNALRKEMDTVLTHKYSTYQTLKIEHGLAREKVASSFKTRRPKSGTERQLALYIQTFEKDHLEKIPCFIQKASIDHTKLNYH